MRSITLRRPILWKVLAGLALLGCALALLASQPVFQASAAGLPQNVATPNPLLSISDETCLQCHGQPGPTMILSNGDVLDLHVSAEVYEASVHGEKGYACVQCHTTVGNYPHPAFIASDLRGVTLQLSESCKACHQQQYELSANSVHATALDDGQRQAATCVDCHGAHDVHQITDDKTGETLPEAHLLIPQTCSKCHNAIYDKYLNSVHGEALQQHNLDVPTCINCHGVHNIEDPRTNAFRLKSPQMCADCHTDEKLMAKYDLSTYVLSSYVSDFHGTTVTLFEKQSPDAEVNKAVCYDCHGIHDIQRTGDPVSGVQLRENLLVRCQSCHPDATNNFPESWLSHYEPTPEKFPVVYYVNLFYQFFIPGVLGFMGVMVVLDFSRMMVNRVKTRRPSDHSHETPHTAAAAAPPAAPAEEVVSLDADPLAAEEELASPPPPLREEPGVGQVDQPPADDQNPAESSHE